MQFIIVNNIPSQIGSTATRTYLGAACGPDGVDDAWSHFNGTIDDIGIWNRALTANEVQSLYDTNLNTSTCNPLPNNLQNGLVGYWPFCGNANDESGNGNDGTVNGAVLTVDRFGNASSAYSFDGFSSIETPSINTAEQITLSAWIYTETPAAVNNSFNYSASIIDHNPEQINNNGYALYYNNILSNYGIYAQTGYSGNPETIISTGVLMPLGSWVHCSFTFNSGIGKIYLNGDLISTDSSLSSLGQNNSPVLFGKAIWAADGNLFQGNLDDIGIWERALNANEIQQLYTLNACTFTIYDTVTVTEIVYDTVSISTTDTLIIETLITSIEPAQENTFLVYPNPANTQITINNGNFGILSGYELKITNSLGQDVFNAEITQQEVTLHISTWGGNGLYILYIQEPNGNTIAVKQIVLQ